MKIFLFLLMLWFFFDISIMQSLEFRNCQNATNGSKIFIERDTADSCECHLVNPSNISSPPKWFSSRKFDSVDGDRVTTLFFQHFLDTAGPKINVFTVNSRPARLEVKKGDRVVFKCEAEARPKPEISIKAIRQSRVLPVQGSISRQKNTRVVRYSSLVSCNDTDTYTCTSHNSVGPDVQESLQIFVKCAPQLLYEDHDKEIHIFIPGRDLKIKIPVIAYPRPETFILTKLRRRVKEKNVPNIPREKSRKRTLKKVVPKGQPPIGPKRKNFAGDLREKPSIGPQGKNFAGILRGMQKDLKKNELKIPMVEVDRSRYNVTLLPKDDAVWVVWLVMFDIIDEDRGHYRLHIKNGRGKGMFYHFSVDRNSNRSDQNVVLTPVSDECTGLPVWLVLGIGLGCVAISFLFGIWTGRFLKRNKKRKRSVWMVKTKHKEDTDGWTEINLHESSVDSKNAVDDVQQLNEENPYDKPDEERPVTAIYSEPIENKFNNCKGMIDRDNPQERQQLSISFKAEVEMSDDKNSEYTEMD